MTLVARRRPAAGASPALGRGALLALAAALLALLALTSLAVGANPLGLGTVWHELWHHSDSEVGAVVRGLRMDRTLLALAVGPALGLAGALMQALTRNPLADPGLLGVNAGAAAAVITVVSVLGLTRPAVTVWFAFLGAAVAAVLVYLLGAGGRAGATPVRLALAGAVITAVLTAYVNGMIMLDQKVFDAYRFWTVGSLTNNDLSVLAQTGPFLLVGALLGLALAHPLNAVALGEDVGRALGASLGRTRVAVAIAITLLCGAATAAVGPIAFVGLTAPHLARALVGPDQRWLLPLSALLGGVLLLAADILGRVVVRPAEVQAGLMVAVVGAPVFIALVRRKRLVHL